MGSRLQAELEEFRRTTQRKLSGELEKMERALVEGRKKNLAGRAISELFAQAPALAPDDSLDDEGGELVIGAQVRHRALGWRGRLERLDGDRAEVTVSGKRLRCDAGDLVALSSAKGDGASAGASARARKGAGRDLESADVPPELHLIGQRVEPALEALDVYLDQALLGARPEVRIVHGHGTGRLRDAVRLHLRKHPGVAAERPGEPNEGGNGATIATLRR